jgi:hypothetical protein
MARNNTDIAMLITDAVLNEFEKNGICKIPLDESKDSKPYSWDLQDVIQDELDKLSEENDYLNKRVRIRGEELYGKVLREFASEVLVAVDNNDQLYFDKSEVEIVKDKKLSD